MSGERNTQGAVDPAVLEKRLKGMLARVFSDAVLDDAERDELHAFWNTSGLTTPQVRDVITEFVRTTYRQAIADGVITEHERNRLAAIVRELRLPDECVPDDVKRLLALA